MNQCEYCHGGGNEIGRRTNIGKPIAEGGYETCFIDLDTSELVVAGDDYGVKEIYFCPMCGRKLGR